MTGPLDLTPPQPWGEQTGDRSAPKVLRGFLFVDLCEFSDFNDSAGDAFAGEVLRILRTVIRAAATRNGARIDKWLGDGAMLVGVERGALMATAMEIISLCEGIGLPLRVRLGGARGEVLVVDGDDYVGRTINLAARLCDLAEPGTVLSPNYFQDILPTAATVSDPYSVRVPGFADPVEVVSIRPHSLEVDPDDRVELLVDTLLVNPELSVAVATAMRSRLNP